MAVEDRVVGKIRQRGAESLQLPHKGSRKNKFTVVA